MSVPTRLIKSVDRFGPERGVEFSTYATPTVVGESKHRGLSGHGGLRWARYT